MQKLTIITSLQKKRSYIKYLYAIFLSIIKMSILFVCRKGRYLRHKDNTRLLIEYGNINLGGHSGIMTSLIRGCKLANIEYVLNPNINDITENVFLCWSNYDEFQKILELKQNGTIKTLVCGPTSYGVDINTMLPLMANSKQVDSFIIASESVRNFRTKKFNITNHDVLKVWISGVEQYPKNNNKAITHKALYYYKHKPLDNEIINLLKKFNIAVTIVKYEEYALSDFIKSLSNSDIAIFDTTYETQGLALAEAWMQNVPTLVRKVTNDEGQSSAPYLTNDTGLFFDNITELESILLNYKNDPTLFLSKFKPHEWVSNNMTDEISAKALMKFFKG